MSKYAVDVQVVLQDALNGKYNIKKICIPPIICYFGAKIILSYINFRKQKQFIAKYANPHEDSLFGFSKLRDQHKDSEGARFYVLDYVNKHKLTACVLTLSPIYKLLAISDPELAQFMMNINPELVNKAGLSQHLFGDDVTGFQGGLLYNEGAEWHRNRKLIGNNFHLEYLDLYIDSMDDSAIQFIDVLAGQNGFQSINHVKDVTAQFALEVMVRNIIGDSDFNLLAENGQQPIYKALITIQSALGFKFNHMIYTILYGMIPFGAQIARILHEPIKKQYQAFQERDEYLKDMIEKKEFDISNGKQSDDLATILLKVKEPNGKSSFSHKQIRCHLYTFLFAGFDTTSATLESILYHLGDEPKWVKRIQDEFSQLGCAINKQTLKRMPTTTAFIKEVQRLATVVDLIIPRRLLKDIQLPNGDVMPKGIQFTIDVGALSQNFIWGENAQVFDPSRYLENSKKMHPYQNIPFSAGRRNCIGRGFAMQELKIATIRLATTINIENIILERDRYNRPVKKHYFTHKFKDTSLQQRFSYL